VKKTPAVLLLVALLLAAAIIAGCGEKAAEKVGGDGTPTADAAEVKTVQVGDIEVAYKVIGAGYPLVMIMGFSGTMDLWDPRFVEDLASRYQVILFDNRGMGDTTTGTAEFTIERFSEDTAGLMYALDIERAHILAWSMGTNIAQELAVRYPEKVNKLVLYAADCGGEEAVEPDPEVMQELTDTSGTAQERGERLFKLLFPDEWLQQHPDFYQQFPKPSEKTSPENIERQAQAMEIWQGIYDLLPDIQASTLVATGTEDVLTPPQNSLVIVNRIPAAWLVQIEGAGHGLMYQFPDRFAIHNRLYDNIFMSAASGTQLQRITSCPRATG
jgi:pimeloyl-ACP methyl ester carboxylesterase